MRKLILSLALVTLFAMGLSIGFATPEVEAIPKPCWVACVGLDEVTCCVTSHGTLCWISGPCQ